MKILNPATGDVLAEIPETTPAAMREKLDRARGDQAAWAETPVPDRLEILRRFRGLLVDRKEKLAQTLTSEVGKPITQSRNEIEGTLSRIDFFLEQVPRVLREEVVLNDPVHKLEEKITLEPLGLIVNISAWNYPYYVGSNVFLPALLTGNAVLYKPSEYATLTGLAIGNLFQETGLPGGAFSVFVVSGEVGAELMKKPVHGIFFTGSYATGRKIAESAAGRMIPVQLELGGKDPVYVCEDVDVSGAAEALADGAFYNTGQSCCAVERIYVHAKIYEPFVDAFLRTVRGFKVGDPADPATYIGPLARAAQVAVLEDQVADAVSKGARLVLGGKRIRGNYFEPTVLLEVRHTMKVMREESFGPIIGLLRVDSDEEASALMADTEYGLTAGVYSKDRARAERLLSRVNAGSAYWNCCDRVSPRLPWSGRGHSGIGSTLSTTGIRAFLQPKAWHLRG
ncbi:MAG TPA: aldehyde dehydrogenase family protein [Planctomycetota bacterium]|nr:aldehyde dehydrogenase family protein [Planctomycetota bacterium]